jgi:hypothetical protein
MNFLIVKKMKATKKVAQLVTARAKIRTMGTLTTIIQTTALLPATKIVTWLGRFVLVVLVVLVLSISSKLPPPPVTCGVLDFELVETLAT